MADILFEVKKAIDRQINRAIANDSANRGIELRPQTQNQAGLSSISGTMEDMLDYATGYDGTNTTMAFTFDVSSWGSGDLWTG